MALGKRLTGFYLFLIPVFLFLNSCSDSGSDNSNSGLSENQEEVISYFKEIVLGFEFGNAPKVIRKWNQDVKIFVGGDEYPLLMNELNEVIEELNTLIARDNIELSTVADSSEANYYAYFGPGKRYEKLYPGAKDHTDSNFGLFFVNWESNYFVNGTMYVDTNRPEPRNQRHLLREELTQSLGMAQDSQRYPDSIFQSSYSTAVTEYSEYDKAVIQLLYHPAMKTGLDESEVDPVLREIIAEVIE